VPFRLGIGTCLLALALARIASPAGAIQPQMEKFEDSVSFVIDDFCDFPIEVSEHIQGTAWFFFDQSGNIVRTNAHVAFQETWTNPDSGKSLIERETVNFPGDPRPRPSAWSG